MRVERQQQIGRTVASVSPSRWHMLFAIVPCLALTNGEGDPQPVPMRDVTIRGSAQAEAKEVKLVVQAAIGTPIGRIPINGHIRLRYDCSSEFTATVSYHALVRFFAKLKHVDLITAMDGRVQLEGQESSECPVMAVQQIVGRAEVEATQLSGWLKLDGDSLAFRGPAWMVGDSSYHSVAASIRGGRQLELRVNMYER